MKGSFNSNEVIFQTLRGKHLHTILLLFLLCAIASSCTLVPDSGPSASASDESTPTAPPDIPSDIELLATAHTVATQISNADPLRTAEAFATVQARTAAQNTKLGESPNPPPRETITPTGGGTGPGGSILPEGIAVPEFTLFNFFSSLNFVSFSSKETLNTLTEFYLVEMQKNGWTILNLGTYITISDAQLHYEKNDRKATITIQLNPISERVSVVITILNK
jgi:hypothetical protein